MVKNIPLNIVWGIAKDSNDDSVCRKIQLNVSQSGIINPGSYQVESRGNVVYWPIEREKK